MNEKEATDRILDTINKHTQKMGDSVTSVYCRVCGVQATPDTLHEFTRDNNNSSGYRNLHKSCKADLERQARERKKFQILVDFTMIPEDKGEKLLQVLAEEAKNDYRSLEHHILHLLAKDRI